MLLGAFRLFSQRMLEHLHAHGFTDLRPIHTALLRNIDAGGTRISVIGERSNMTKQAVGQLIKECESLGYLRTSADPIDRRAKIVRYTPKGERFLASLPQVFRAASRDIEGIIGRDRMNTLARILEKLVAADGSPRRAPQAAGRKGGAS
jgi:DNA-binding MarR family transcriptional regulator